METRKCAWSPASLIVLPFEPAPTKPRGNGGMDAALPGSPNW
jgi:hypothetical protein